MGFFKKYLQYTRNIYVVLISWIILSYITYGVDPYLPNYIALLGGAESDIGWIYGIIGLIEIPLLLIGGILGDFIGRRRLIVSLTSVIILAYTVYYLAINPIYILLGMMIQTLASLYRPSLMALVSDSLRPGERGRGVIFIRILPDLLAIPAPLIIGYLIEYYGGSISGYKIAFLIAIILASAAFIFRGFYLEETLKTRPAKNVFKALVESVSSLKLWSIVPKPMKRLIILRMFSHLALGLYARYLIRYATLNGVSADLWGSIYSLASALSIFASIGLMPYVDSIEHRLGLSIGFLLRGVGLVIFLFGGLPGFIIGLPLLFVARSFLVPFIRRYQIDSTPHEVRARVIAIDLIARNLFMSIGLILSSLILVFTGQNLLIPMVLATVLTIVSGIVFPTYLPRLTVIEE